MKTTSLLTPFCAGFAAVALLTAPSLRADQQLSTPFSMLMKVNAIVDESDCQNSPGPEISLGGDIRLRGLKARVIFSNNRKGTHLTTVVARYDVTLLTDGDTITIPKQPVRGGVGGNPHLYLQFHDGKGMGLSEEFYLGRCVQGLTLTTEVMNEALARATIHAEGCSNRRGPFITMGGDIVLSGLHAKFIFRNNLKGTHTAEDSRDVAIILDGSSITLPKQPVNGGVGGNPLISIQFLDDKGEPLNDPVLLGRCVQL